ncbi:glycoside hydrolase superfamily [Ilyonectria sp. MPI-CAGE-AT-0026]|nr:glycoside hydrolase superfamily [Ilyonectria sp. MPI-CAGE-AT-0026]
MLTSSLLVAIAAFASSAQAWLPSDGSAAAVDKRSLGLFPPPGQEGVDKRWLPGSGKIRGVNLGSLFVFEPWISSSEWAATGCANQNSEFDCVMNNGQDTADTNFQAHWRRFINETDLNDMVNYGLNTVRIPLGYWLKESLVDSSEHFPKGGLDYLTEFVGWASDRGFYIILDLHGAPGAQQTRQPFTGQYADTVGFYNDYNYGRAIEWLEWIVNIVHTTNEYRNVGMIELVNEPLSWDNAVDTLRSSYYPDAYKAIRTVEDNLSVKSNDRLHIQMMSSLWGSGNPVEHLDDTSFTAFDDHRYLKWDTAVEVSHDSYISTSCSDDRNSDGPSIVGEWSLAVPDNVEGTDEWSPSPQKDFYSKWFAAQVHAYESTTLGWVFWTWKTNLGDDYRWSYKAAVEAGVIPTDLSNMSNPC